MEDKMNQIKKIPISQDNISHTFLGLAGIADHTCYRAEEDLSSPEFKPQKL